MNDHNPERDSKPFNISRAHVETLIETLVYFLGSADFQLPRDDKYHRGLLSVLVGAIMSVADDAGFDLGSELAAPIYCDEAPHRKHSSQYGLQVRVNEAEASAWTR
jgi:hypothetical protein